MKIDSAGNLYGRIGNGIGKLDALGNLLWLVAAPSRWCVAIHFLDN